MGSYIPHTEDERGQMLAAVGIGSLEELYQSVPQDLLLGGRLNLPEGMSELEVREKVSDLAR